jgi:hypothetical protein
MAIQNLSAALAIGLGGWWYETMTEWWGSHVAFDVLVGIGAAFTAGCWLLVPFVSRKNEGQPAASPGP